MDLTLSDEQRRLIEEARTTASSLPPREGGSEGRVDRELLLAVGQAGIVPRLFPASAGGSREGAEISAFELCLLREALAQESTEAETALAMQGLCGYPILQSGSADLVQRWVPSIA